MNRRGRNLYVKYAILTPAVCLIAVTIVLSFFAALFSAFRVDGAWGLQNFVVVLTQAPYATVLGNTLWISAVVSVASVLLAFPVCAYFARSGRFATTLFVATMTIVLAISMLVRTYSWQVILAFNGPLNDLGMAAGLWDKRQMMLFTRPAVVVAMIQFMTPYAALILFSAMRKVDYDVVTAAQTLGAGWWLSFKNAYWPQVSGAVVLATVLVFSISSGFFVAPALLGGPDTSMLGNQIQSDLIFNYQNGSGLATAQGVVLAVILAVVSLAGFRLGGSTFLKNSR
jgi:putative spermidine/putrescine transport system permease protein